MRVARETLDEEGHADARVRDVDATRVGGVGARVEGEGDATRRSDARVDSGAVDGRRGRARASDGTRATATTSGDEREDDGGRGRARARAIGRNRARWTCGVDAAASDAGRDAEDEVARALVTASEWEELRGRTRLVARAFARRTLARYDGNGTRGRGRHAGRARNRASRRQRD